MAYASFFEGRPNAQRSLLAGVLLVVLVAAVGGAAWLARTRGAAARAAEDILRQVHEATLAQYWGDQDETLLFVHRDDTGQATGWSANTRRRRADGYAGATLSSSGAREDWELSEDATSGGYEGPTLGPGRAGGTTTIGLRGDVLTVRQSQGAVALTAHAATPRNYIPEGMTSLVVRRVARAGKPSAFRMILNNRAVVNGDVNFAQVTMTPRGESVVEMEVRGLDLTVRSVYHLDPDGRPAKIEQFDKTPKGWARMEFLRVGIQELLGYFPDDQRLAELVEELKRDRPAQTRPRGISI